MTDQADPKPSKPLNLSTILKANEASEAQAGDADISEALQLSGGRRGIEAVMAEAGMAGNSLRDSIAGLGGANELARIVAEATSAEKAMRDTMLSFGGLDRMIAESSTAEKVMRDTMLGVGGLAGMATEAMSAEKTMRDVVAGLGGPSALAAITAQTMASENALSAVMAGTGYSQNIEKRMSDLLGVAGQHSALGKVANEIASQQRSLDTLVGARAHDIDRIYSMPPLRIPENPLIETNKRLARIERQFEVVSEVARESAQTAVGLQASGAEFIQKFEKAATDTNKSGNKAMLVALVAVLITIFQTVSPFLLPDGDAVALRQSVEGLQAEISSMRAEQAETSQRLIDALAAGDRETAAAVREAMAPAVEPPNDKNTVPPVGRR